MRDLIALMLAAIVAVPAFADEGIAAKVLAISTGAMVKVRLTTNENLRGRLGAVSENQFVLRVAARNQIENRTICFDQVQSISRLHPPGRSHQTDLLIAAVVTGAITLIAPLAIHASHG